MGHCCSRPVKDQCFSGQVGLVGPSEAKQGLSGLSSPKPGYVGQSKAVEVTDGMELG